MNDWQHDGGRAPREFQQIVELVRHRDVRAQTTEFLRRWFGPCSDDTQPDEDGYQPVASLWCVHRTNPNESRTYTRPVAEAEDLIGDIEADGKLNGEWNVYVRCTTLKYEPQRRGTAADSCQLPGLWVDLDEKDGVTWQGVESFIAALAPMPVTAVTYSGGGWHIWIAFTEPVYGLPPIGKTLRRWRATVARIARSVGIVADDACSGDPARVMRLVGTANVKLERPAPVLCQFVGHDWHRAIRPDDAEDLLDAVPDRPEIPHLSAGPAATGRPGDQYTSAMPMIAVIEAMGGHDWWTDEQGDTYVMRPGKDRGGHGAVLYADGHVAFYSSSWVGPNSSFGFRDVKLALSGDESCVYNDSFRLTAHAWFGPEGTGYDAAVAHAKQLGYRASTKMSDADFERLVARIAPKRRELASHEQFTAAAVTAAVDPAYQVQNSVQPAQSYLAPVVPLVVPVFEPPSAEPDDEAAAPLPPAVRLLVASGALTPPGMPPDVTELQAHQVPTFGVQTLRQLAGQERDPRPWLVDGIIVSGQAGVLGATPKAGKTMMGADMAFSVASGTLFLGIRQCAQGPVIVCLGEGSTTYFRQRLYAIGRSRRYSREQVDALPIAITERTPIVADDIDLAGFANVLLTSRQAWGRDPALVIVDPWYLAAGGEAEIGNIHSAGRLLERPRLVVSALPRFERDTPITDAYDRPVIWTMPAVDRFGNPICDASGNPTYRDTPVIVNKSPDPALMIVHHYNRDKSSVGAERFSGAGIWAWGRFLIAFDEDPDRIRTDSYKDDKRQPTDVVFRVEVSGENVATRPFAVRRIMWTDNHEQAKISPDLAELHYEIRTAPLDAKQDRDGIIPRDKRGNVKPEAPVKVPAEPAKWSRTYATHVADILEENGGVVATKAVLYAEMEVRHGVGRRAVDEVLATMRDDGDVGLRVVKGNRVAIVLVRRPEIRFKLEGESNGETDTISPDT